MTTEHIIALDLGTSMIKAVLFDRAGRQLASAARPNRYQRLAGGGAEQDSTATLTAARQTVAELVGQIPGGPSALAALAVTGQGDGTWLVDDAGQPVGDSLLWLDARAAGIVADYERSGVRQEIYPRTGCGLNACNQSAQLAWLAAHEPERIARASTAMHCKDWVYFGLTGERVTDVSEGSFTFGNFRTRNYDDEVIAALALEDLRHLLPPIIDGAKQTHPLSSEAAAATGLTQGLPVSLGYVDVVCSALGAGVYAPAMSSGCSLYGSTGMHIRLVDDLAKLDLRGDPSGYVMPLPGSDAVLRMQSHLAATFNFDWLAGIIREAAAMFGPEPKIDDLFAAMNDRAEAASVGTVLYHPYIDEGGERGPFLNPQARAQFLGLTASTGLGDLGRAVYEGLAFAGRHCFEAAGGVPEEVRMTGGGSRSSLLRDVLAAVLGARVRASLQTESGAAGAAIIAALAVGLVADLDEACATWVKPTLGPVCEPNPSWQEQYQLLYKSYLLTTTAMPPVWAALAETRQ